MSNQFRIMCLIFLSLFLLSACAAPSVVAKRRVFWPDAPDIPRIEWIGTYANSNDFLDKKSLFNMFVGDSEETVTVKRPLSIASDGAGKVFVTNAETKMVDVFDFNTRSTYVLGGDLITHLTGISLDERGNLYIADASSRKIYVMGLDKKVIRVLDLSEHVKGIAMFAVDKRNAHLVIPDPKEHRIVVTDLEGKFLFAFGKRGSDDGDFNTPLSVAIEPDGGIVVCDSFNSRIQRFTAQGAFVNKFGNRGDGIGEFSLIKAVAVDSEGHVYVTDGREGRVTIFSPSGELLMAFGSKYSHSDDSRVSAGGFLMPQGIYIDQNDRIFIADQLNNRFQVFQYLNTRYLTDFPIVPPPTAPVK